MAVAKDKKAPAAKKPAKKKPAAEKSATASTEAKTKKFQDFTIITKRSGRFEVLGKNGKNVNGLDKAKVLVDAKLVKTGLTKAPAKTEEAAPAPEGAPA